MTSKIMQYFADKLHTIVSYPITITKAVFDSDGNRLDEILSTMVVYEEEDISVDLTNL